MKKLLFLLFIFFALPYPASQADQDDFKSLQIEETCATKLNFCQHCASSIYGKALGVFLRKLKGTLHENGLDEIVKVVPGGCRGQCNSPLNIRLDIGPASANLGPPLDFNNIQLIKSDGFARPGRVQREGEIVSEEEMQKIANKVILAALYRHAPEYFRLHEDELKTLLP